MSPHISSSTGATTGDPDPDRVLEPIQADPAAAAADPSPPPFDPSAMTVGDVLELLEAATDDERDAVLAAERSGKNRKGITGAGSE